ncbi:MAG: YeeE/YedE thiosulfate transporter family protein [Bauldia sp.]
MLAIAVAFLVALVIGFAAHRASVCTVRAVGEVMGSGTGYMFFSILKSIFWVTVITVPVFFLVQDSAAGIKGWSLTAGAVAGGFIFGAGAGINGACAYSTMARLVDGEGRMLVTVVAFGLGVGIFVLFLGGDLTQRPVQVPAMMGALAGWAPIVAGIVILVALFEAVRLWRTRPKETGLVSLIVAPRYRLSTAAMLVGLAGALTFLLSGPSGYSSTFELIIEATFGTRPWPNIARWTILVAVLIGMLISTLQRGTFRLDLAPRRAWARNVVGGILMGFGVALTPGGNDALVLYGIPTISPHALPAYLAMAVGIVVALLLMRLLFSIETRVECRNDLYVSDTGLGSRPWRAGNEPKKLPRVE